VNDRHIQQAAQLFFVRTDPVQETDDFRTALKNRAVRRIFRSLLAVGNVFGPSMAGDGNDSFTAYNEGVRAGAILLATKIEQAKPGEVARLMAESVKDRTEAEALAWVTAHEQEED
jgi:hypothetical protein